MYSAKIENKNGEVLLLTGDEPRYQVIDITGLNPARAQINAVSTAGLDGARFNSSKLNTKNIVISIKINGNTEANRINLYNYFRTKEWCRFYYSNDTRDVFIDGYVENVECAIFSKEEIMQISIICPSPYFKALSEIISDISNTLKLFTFPFSINENEPIPFSEYTENRITRIYNDGESETGVVITVTFGDEVNAIIIRNTTTGENFELDYAFVVGDIVTIDTNKGQKDVYLMRNGVKINMFPALKNGSVFFQLAAGINTFGYLADGAENKDIRIVFTYRNQYRGV